MEDYIDALLMYLSEERSALVSSEYLIRLRQEEAAYEALSRTLTEEQKPLLRAYDDARSAAASTAEDTYARAAFQLAREIFR